MASKKHLYVIILSLVLKHLDALVYVFFYDLSSMVHQPGLRPPFSFQLILYLTVWYLITEHNILYETVT